MNVAGISTGWGSVRDSLQKLRSKGGVTKDELSEVQSGLKDSSFASSLDELQKSFDTVDIDKNGTLDDSELRGYSKQLGGKGQRGRSPGDSKALSQTELSGLAEQSGDETLSKVAASFDEADTDKDGKVSRQELEAFAKLSGLSLPNHNATPSEGLTKDDLTSIAEKCGDETALKIANSFEHADSDGSGKVSKSEFEQFAKANGLSTHAQHTHRHSVENGQSFEDSLAGVSETADTNSTTSLAGRSLQTALRAYLSSAYTTSPESDLLTDTGQLQHYAA